MGLDGVELVMACEDAFDVRIADPEAERIRTPADMMRLMIGKLELQHEGACGSLEAFNQLRGAMVSAFGVERSWIRTGTPIEHVLPRGSRAEALDALQRHGPDSGWPPLTRRSPVVGLRVRVPRRVRSVGHLARWIMLQGPVPEGTRADGWTRNGVRTTVRRVVAQFLALDDLNDDDEFVGDLGVD